MAQFVVRKIENGVKARLKRRAARHGRSFEDEVRHILRDAVKAEYRPARALGSRIAARFRKIGLEHELPRLPRQRPRPPDLGK